MVSLDNVRRFTMKKAIATVVVLCGWVAAVEAACNIFVVGSIATLGSSVSTSVIVSQPPAKFNKVGFDLVYDPAYLEPLALENEQGDCSMTRVNVGRRRVVCTRVSRGRGIAFPGLRQIVDVVWRTRGGKAKTQINPSDRLVFDLDQKVGPGTVCGGVAGFVSIEVLP
jgi:hypothetical protein